MSEAPDWAEEARRLVAGLGAAVHGAVRGGGDGGSADCRWCPMCQAAAVVRGERPEVTTALADVLGRAADALRAFAEDPSAPAGGTAGGARPPAGEPSGGESSGGEPGGAPASPGPAGADGTAVVQRIEIA